MSSRLSCFLLIVSLLLLPVQEMNGSCSKLDWCLNDYCPWEKAQAKADCDAKFALDMALCATLKYIPGAYKNCVKLAK